MTSESIQSLSFFSLVLLKISLENSLSTFDISGEMKKPKSILSHSASILRGVFIDMFNYRGVWVKIHRDKNPCTSPVS
ncbi:MAG: hypothetical protein ACJAYY_000271 [Paraglaciecola sp.]|jgi:hypothetical protein|uniref:hypothetical protein n=1 Tax=Polaribacter sp. TaxID=1920175 RepID=UPI003AC46DA0